MQNLICVTGPRGAGKETVLNLMLSCFPKENSVHRIVPFTTREKRENETDGKEYFFISELEFLEIQKHRREEILCSVQIGEDEDKDKYRSGTLKSEFDRYKNGIIDVTVEGARTLSCHAKNSLLIYVYANPDERIKRIMLRQNINEREASTLIQNEPSPSTLETVGILYPEFLILYNHDGHLIQVERIIKKSLSKIFKTSIY
ncbi:MAG: hypothetical protein ABH951_01440 [Patescibacteria group bacterium]